MNPPTVFKKSLIKPDGRELLLYSDEPIDDRIEATNPNHDPITSTPHLRWHPLREEWVAYASHRQNRTFLPPKEYNPLAPSESKEFPTELPAGKYQAAVFENLFASLSPKSVSAPDLFIPTAPANGICEVVVFTQDPNTSLGNLSIPQIVLLLKVWIDRYEVLHSRPDIKYVLPFENRGVEVGVTLHHPHGQIYAYPFVPPLQQKMQQSQELHWHLKQETLISDFIKKELEDQTRVIYRNESHVIFIPICARYPYEVWICPLRAVSKLSQLYDHELMDLARALKTILLKFDNLWGKTFPYLMAFYSAPNDGEEHPEWHFHIEFYPPYRTRDRLKYLAGTEIAAGMFVNDSLPEEKANDLKNVEISWEGVQ